MECTYRKFVASVNIQGKTNVFSSFQFLTQNTSVYVTMTLLRYIIFSFLAISPIAMRAQWINTRRETQARRYCGLVQLSRCLSLSHLHVTYAWIFPSQNCVSMIITRCALMLTAHARLRDTTTTCHKIIYQANFSHGQSHACKATQNWTATRDNSV